MAGAAWNVASREAQLTATRRHMVPALRHCLEARAACPLMARPHILLAANVPYLTRSEPALAHLNRAKELVTNDPQMWFLFGFQELLAGQVEQARGDVAHAELLFRQACASWRRSLELSDQHLTLILDLGQGLGPQRLADEVVPERADLLFKAAEYLYPQREAAAERRPFLAKALTLLQARPGVAKPSDNYLYAKAYEAMGQTDEALAAYHKALTQDPRQLGWRFEMAQLLHQSGRLAEAQRELQAILRLQPDNANVRGLLDTVIHELARKSG
jgi:tetratricopeptide (TPR) repeat protein